MTDSSVGYVFHAGKDDTCSTRAVRLRPSTEARHSHHFTAQKATAKPAHDVERIGITGDADHRS